MNPSLNEFATPASKVPLNGPANAPSSAVEVDPDPDWATRNLIANIGIGGGLIGLGMMLVAAALLYLR